MWLTDSILRACSPWRGPNRRRTGFKSRRRGDNLFRYLWTSEFKTQLQPLVRWRMSIQITIKWGPKADKSAISQYTLDVIEDCMLDAEVRSVTITSTKRSVHDQARIMFEQNIKDPHGVDTTTVQSKPTYKMYNSAMRGVIRTGADSTNNLPGRFVETTAYRKDQVVTGMAEDIEKKNPGRGHFGDFSKLQVLDIDPASVVPKENYNDFYESIVSDARITRVFAHAQGDSALHIEVPQTA